MLESFDCEGRFKHRGPKEPGKAFVCEYIGVIYKHGMFGTEMDVIYVLPDEVLTNLCKLSSCLRIVATISPWGK